VGANGQRYETDERAPIVDMPEWLARLLFNNQVRMARRLERGEYAEMIVEAVGLGQRNDILTRIAGHELAVKGSSRADEVLAWLIVFNRQNCKPPLGDDEVEKIVISIAGREAKKAIRAL
jgi:hypothetical protein